jgi:DNA-binding beta-propeller fold protein YncE
MVMTNRTLSRAALALCAGLLAFSTPALSDTITPRVIPVGKWAEGVAFDGNSLWVAESGQRTIAQVNPSQGSIIRRINVGRLPVNMVFANDGAIYTLVQTDKLIWQQFPGAPQGRQIGGLDDCPQAMTTSRQHLWVLTWDCNNSNIGHVIRIDPRTNERRYAGAVSEIGQALAPHQGKIWVANARGPTLFVIDEQSLLFQSVSLQGVSPLVIAANGAQVHVGGSVGAGGSQGIVVSVNPATMQEVRRQVVDQPIAAMTDDDRHVVAIGNRGKIYVFSAGDLELRRTIEMPGIGFKPEVGAGPKSMMIQGDNLYVTNGQQFGENGAILILSGWRPAAMPVPSPATPQPTAPPAANVTDCPYQVVSVGDATGIWMYQDPDTSAPKVIAVPAESKGLVADRCLTNWCRVTFRGSSGWVQRSHIQPVCN